MCLSKGTRSSTFQAQARNGEAADSSSAARVRQEMPIDRRWRANGVQYESGEDEREERGEFRALGHSVTNVKIYRMICGDRGRVDDGFENEKMRSGGMRACCRFSCQAQPPHGLPFLPMHRREKNMKKIGLNSP